MSHAFSVVINAWPDADLAGDKDSSTKSTSGCFIQVSDTCGLCMPSHWATHKQGGAAHSTPEAEFVSGVIAQGSTLFRFSSGFPLSSTARRIAGA